MATSKSTFLGASQLGHVLRGVPYAMPTSLLVGLLSTLPADGGAGLVEVVGNGYGRATYGAGDTYWSVPSGASPVVVSNLQPVTFPQATGSWPVAGFALWDQGGVNLLYWGIAQGGPLPVVAGAIPQFGVGALVIKEA